MPCKDKGLFERRVIELAPAPRDFNHATDRERVGIEFAGEVLIKW